MPSLSGGLEVSDAELTAIAGLVSAANKLPYFDGSGTATLADFTAAGRAILDDADATAQRITLGLVLGTNVQAYDVDLLAIAGLTSAADKVPYFTGSGTAAVADFTSAGRSIAGAANVAAQLTALGIVRGTASLAWDFSGAQRLTKTITVTGAVAGDEVALAIPAAFITALNSASDGPIFIPAVTAADTVTIIGIDALATAGNYSATTWGATVIKR